MGNVIQVDNSRWQKNASKESSNTSEASIYVPDFGRSQGKSSQDIPLGERIDRIKTSIQRINELMAELRNTKAEDAPLPPAEAPKPKQTRLKKPTVVASM